MIIQYINYIQSLMQFLKKITFDQKTILNDGENIDFWSIIPQTLQKFI